MSELVFRIEHPDSRKGPWTHDWDDWNVRHNAIRRYSGNIRPEDMLTPHDEGFRNLCEYDGFVVCAFYQMSQLLRWFKPYHRGILADNGFKVYKMLAHRVFEKGVHQCIIDRDNAEVLAGFQPWRT